MSEVRAAIVALIRAEQKVPQDRGALHALSRSIDRPGGPGWRSATLTLDFGKGYFDWSKVLVHLDGEVVGEAEVEEAAAAYCEGRVPEVRKRGTEQPTPPGEGP